MTNTISSTRFARSAAGRRFLARRSSAALFFAAALVVSGATTGQAQPLLAGQQPYRAKEARSEQREDAYDRAIESRLIAQSMRNRRVMMLLPIRTGDNWKSTPEFTSSFLRESAATLRRAVGDTNRFSLLEVRRFNPILMRAVQDGVASSDDLATLLAQPSTPNASTFLSKINFDKAPLQATTETAVIGSFVLESMTLADNVAKVKVTGRMYPANGQAPLRALSATASVPYSGSATSAASQAASQAINRVLAEFVRTAGENEILTGETPSLVTPEVVPVAPKPSSSVVLPGKPIKGASGSMDATSSTRIPVLGASNITTEVPPAETFATAQSDPNTAVTSGDVGSTEGSAGSTSDSTSTEVAPTSDSTVSTDESGAVVDASSDNSASEATNSVTSTGSETSTTSNADGTPVVSPTATDGTASTGTTDDGTGSEGTVGAMSNSSSPKMEPPSSFGDDGLAFER